MGVCKFKTDEIKRCVKHALQSNKWRMPWSEEKPQPAILFVHDHGIYCMSNGDPRDMIDEKNTHCVYAKGCDPRTDQDFYDEAEHLVGGDDFVEIIKISEDFLKHCDTFSEMEVKITSRSMSVTFKKPKKNLRKAV